VVKLPRRAGQQVVALHHGANALALLFVLLDKHGHIPGKRFAIVPGAMRAAGLLAIWLFLLVFIVYPLVMLLLRAFLADGEFTLDAGTVMVDGLLRQGILSPEDPLYLEILRLLKP